MEAGDETTRQKTCDITAIRPRSGTDWTSELGEKLQLELADRTIRRWLNELVVEGLVEKSGSTKNTKYIAIKPVGSREGISSCFSSGSLEAISKIKRPKFERPPVAYNEEWLESYEPNKTFYFSESVRQQLWSAGSKANDHDPAGTYAHKIFSRLLIDLSFNSSRLEGNTYSLLETEKLLIHGDGVPGKLVDRFKNYSI